MLQAESLLTGLCHADVSFIVIGGMAAVALRAPITGFHGARRRQQPEHQAISLRKQTTT